MALIDVDISTRFVIRLWDKAPVKGYLNLIITAYEYGEVHYGTYLISLILPHHPI